MNEIQVFNYEQNEIRTVNIDGELWFVLKDVCDVLDIANSRDTADRLDDDEKNTVAINDGIPGNPNKTIINESGLYSVILLSRKPEAKSFKRWVTHDVLPQIRKTGCFKLPKETKPRAKPVDVIFNQRMRMAKAFSKVTGIPLEIALATAINEAEKLTGEDYSYWKKALPKRVGGAPIPNLNATQTGQLLSISAQEVNKLLHSAGLQDKDTSGAWRLSDNGKEYGETFPFDRNGHTDYCIRWRDSVVKFLKGEENGNN
jgi:prophage antirepressor-like protein